MALSFIQSSAYPQARLARSVILCRLKERRMLDLVVISGTQHELVIFMNVIGSS